jgi:hypothetical protein
MCLHPGSVYDIRFATVDYWCCVDWWFKSKQILTIERTLYKMINFLWDKSLLQCTRIIFLTKNRSGPNTKNTKLFCSHSALFFSYDSLFYIFLQSTNKMVYIFKRFKSWLKSKRSALLKRTTLLAPGIWVFSSLHITNYDYFIIEMEDFHFD